MVKYISENTEGTKHSRVNREQNLYVLHNFNFTEVENSFFSTALTQNIQGNVTSIM